MYTRRTLIRVGGGAVLGGLLNACRGTSTATPTSDMTSDMTGDTSAATTTTSPVLAPPSTTTPSTPSSTVSSTSPTSSTVSSSTPPAVVPWAGADFGELDEFLAATNGESFVIVERGLTVHEWYRGDDTYARDIGSAQKSVLSLLVGRAVADGIVGLDTFVDDVLGTGWTPHGQSSGITVRHLLTMTSGLDDSLTLVSAPGTAWLYSGAFAQLFAILSATAGRDVDHLANEWLFDPARADGAVFYERRTDDYAPIGMRATARDLVAIGQMVLDQSQPGLAERWLDDSFEPSQAFNASYGYLWWLNGQESFMLPGPTPPVRPGPLIPTAPVDLVAALGKGDQKLYVSRSLELVVVRLGDKADPESRPALSTFDAALWAILDRLRTVTE